MKVYPIIVIALLLIIHVHSQEKPELRIHKSFVGGEIRFSPDLKYFISGWEQLFLYETKSLKHLQTFPQAVNQSSFFGFISDFHFVNGDSVYDIRTASKVAGVVTDSIIYFDPENQRVFCYGKGELIVKRFNSGFKQIKTIKDNRLKDGYSIMDIFDRGRYILISTNGQKENILVIDLDQGTVLSNCKVSYDFSDGMFIDLNHVILTNTLRKDNEFIIFDFRENKITRTIKSVFNQSGIPNSFRFLQDRKHAVSPFIDGTIKIWDPNSGEIIKILSKDGYKADGVYVTADEKTIISTSAKHFPIIWDLKTGASVEISIPNIKPVGQFEILTTDKLGILTAVRTSGAEGCIFNFNVQGKIDNLIREIWFPFSRHLEIPPDDFLVTFQDDLLSFRDLQTGEVKNLFREKKFVGIRYNRIITKGDSSYKVWSCPDGLKLMEFASKDKIEFNNESKLLGVKRIAPDSFEVLDIFGQSRIAIFGPKRRQIDSPFYHSEISPLFRNSDIIEMNEFTIIYSDSEKTKQESISESRTLYDLKTGDILLGYYDSATPEEYLRFKKLIISKDSKYAAFPDTKNHTHKVYDLQKKQLLFCLNRDSSMVVNTIEFSNDSKNVIYNTKDAIVLCELPTGRIVQTVKIDSNVLPGKFIFSPDDSMVFLVSRNNYPSLFVNLFSGKVASKINIESRFLQAVIFEKDLVLSALLGGNQFFKLSTGEELLTLYDIGEDWAVTTPGGLFDASPGAFEKMYYVQGLDIIDFEQIKDKYWEPGLYEKVMKGEPLRSVESIDKKLDLWPEITELLFKENYEKLQISLENQGGGIGKVQVFLNGKEILNDARDDGIASSQQSAKITVNLKDHPLLINGENHVEVMTWNESGTLSSKRERAEFLVEKQVNLPEVYLVAVGISDYLGEAIDLKYAAKDASDFMTAAGIAAKNLFTEERTHKYLLTTDKDNQRKPTKKEIEKTFNEIIKTAKPEDVVVLYLAGHGLNLGGENGDLHYLTMDAFSPNPAIYNDPSIKEKCTISGSEIVDLLSKVPALKQVFIIDACSAGKIVDNLVVKRDIESSIVKALERMKDRAGLHIITGSAADAVSYEASKFGQGLLTYSLLAGIKGLALKNNLTVDVALLMQHAREMVPKLAQGIGGIQEPRIFSPKGAESFDIGLVTEKDKVLIPLAKEKQIFIQSNLQDFNELSDVLGLSELIDEQFAKLSEDEKDAPLIFWAVRSYPEANRISGGYSVDGDQIEVRFKIFKDKNGGETITVTGLKSNMQDVVNKIVTLAIKSIGD